jgi:hypothetical protein
MIEHSDARVLGAVRWTDAVTAAPIELPLVARSDRLRFVRNLGGLSVIVGAIGLEKYSATFDLADLAPADVVANGALTFTGEVFDPTGSYLPRSFTVRLPRDASPALLPPDQRRPPDSVFTPIDVALLPSPAVKVAAGWAQVRVLIRTALGAPLPNALARVVATADHSLLGCGLADARGEALVAIPGLKLFAPGATIHEVVSVETTARLEIVPPPAGAVVDWTVLRDTAAAPADVDPTPLALRAGATYSRRYPFSA